VTIGCSISNTALTVTSNASFIWSNGATVHTITLSPTLTTTYSVTATSSNGCTATDEVVVSVNDCNPKPVLNAKVFLNHVNTSTLLMDNYLAGLANFPLADPYSSAPFDASYIKVNNNTTESINASVLSTTGNNAIVDWLFIELRQGNSGSTKVVYTKAALYQSDGDIVDMNGTSPVAFNVPSGNYYVAIRHRNSLGFRTNNLLSLSPSSNFVNLTNNSTPIFASTLLSIGNNIYVMQSGDVNSDGAIDAFDYVEWEISNGLFDDYSLTSDINFDGAVDAFDYIIWEVNNGNFENIN
jgi:hypothetical protein